MIQPQYLIIHYLMIKYLMIQPQCSGQPQVAKLDQAGDEVRQLLQQGFVQEVHLDDHNDYKVTQTVVVTPRMMTMMTHG